MAESADIKTRLLRKRLIDPVTDCWLYIGSRYKGRKGELKYGFIKYQNKNVLVHRLSLIVFKDIVFDVNEQSNHILECKNMHCFNPDHLYKGTQKQNMEDRKKLRPPARTKVQKNAEYYRRHNQHRKNHGR